MRSHCERKKLTQSNSYTTASMHAKANGLQELCDSSSEGACAVCRIKALGNNLALEVLREVHLTVSNRRMIRSAIHP